MSDKGITRIGVLIPATNLVVEAELYAFLIYEYGLATRVVAHFSRIEFTTRYAENSQSFLAEIRANASSAAAVLRTIPLSAVGFFCTSALLCHDAATLSGMRSALAMESMPIVTPMQAIISACEQLEADKVLLVSPYSSDIASSLRERLESTGVAVIKERHFGLMSSAEIIAAGRDRLKSVILEEANDQINGIVLACTNLPTFHLISDVEKEMGLPVISSNQAALWRMLGVSGLSAGLSSRFGSLFALERVGGTE